MEPIPIVSPKSGRVRKSKKIIVRADVVPPNDSPSEPQSPPTNEHVTERLLEHEITPVYHDMSSGWHCCFGPVSNMACGWPQGSCTALLTILSVVMFIGGMIGVLVYGIVANNVNVILAVLAVFTNGFSFAFGHYIGKSAATTASRVPTTAVAPPEIIV